MLIESDTLLFYIFLFCFFCGCWSWNHQFGNSPPPPLVWNCQKMAMVRGADGCASTAALVEWSALKAVQKVGRKPHLYRLATAQKPYYLSIFTFVVPASDRQTPLHFGVQKRCSSLFWKDSIKIYELSWQVYIYILRACVVDTKLLLEKRPFSPPARWGSLDIYKGSTPSSSPPSPSSPSPPPPPPPTSSGCRGGRLDPNRIASWGCSGGRLHINAERRPDTMLE